MKSILVLLTLFGLTTFANYENESFDSASDIVEFHIANGTQKGPWNTAETTVQVKVGQTLRIINDDTIAHLLHTPGKPCPHGSSFGPGKYYDCVIENTASPENDILYDHQFGSTSRFYVRATN